MVCSLKEFNSECQDISTDAAVHMFSSCGTRVGLDIFSIILEIRDETVEEVSDLLVSHS